MVNNEKRSEKMRFKTFVRMVGLTNLLASAIAFTLSFIVAYLSPTKTARIMVDILGEADVEIIMILLFFIPTIYVVWEYINHIFNKEDELDGNRNTNSTTDIQ